MGSFFGLNSQTQIRSKFTVFVIYFMSVSYLVLNSRNSPSFAVSLRAPVYLMSLELPYELTSCATRQPLQSPNLVRLYMKVPYMFFQQDLNPCCFELSNTYTPLYPGYTQYIRVGSADYALAVSQYIGMRSRYIIGNIKCHRNVQGSYFGLLTYLT